MKPKLQVGSGDQGYYGKLWGLVTDKRVGSWSVDLDVIKWGNDRWICAHRALLYFFHSIDWDLLYLT